MKELIQHTDNINELLARYGVKFGIYKNNTFKEQLFPFDSIPRVITSEPTSADDIPEDYDRDNVCGGQALILSIINEIVFGNAGDRYKELLNEFMKRNMSEFL